MKGLLDTQSLFIKRDIQVLHACTLECLSTASGQWRGDKFMDQRKFTWICDMLDLVQRGEQCSVLKQLCSFMLCGVRHVLTYIDSFSRMLQPATPQANSKRPIPNRHVKKRHHVIASVKIQQVPSRKVKKLYASLIIVMFHELNLVTDHCV